MTSKGLTQVPALEASAADVASNPVKVDISNAKKVTVVMTRTEHTSGSSAFTFQVSDDGVAWIDYANMIPNLAHDNTEYETRVSTVTLGSNTSNFCSMDPRDAFNFLRVNLNNTTDGEGEAYVNVEK
ncbi:MAG: hypothetical protein ACP5NS_05065 [Candidatus Pacearchaeota archaeon]